jgi:hypothetical protein
MALTQAQLTLVKAAILADPDLAARPLNSDGAYDIAVILNKKASPTFTVWRTNVPAAEVGIAMNSSEVAGLTTANTNRLLVMQAYSGGVFNPSFPDVQAGFNSVFAGAGGALTRAGLLAVWKRAGLRIEKILATGTGSDLSPATMTVEGQISPEDVHAARVS